MSKWIWRFGEFEIWHNLLVHTRRQAYGFPEPPIWKVHMPDPVVRFVKETETEGGKIRIRALGSFTMMYYTGENYETESKTWGKEEVILPPGKVRIQILVQNRDSFPAIYVDGVVESDETWLASDATPDLRPVGCTDLLCDPEHTPDVFPFEYEEPAFRRLQKPVKQTPAPFRQPAKQAQAPAPSPSASASRSRKFWTRSGAWSASAKSPKTARWNTRLTRCAICISVSMRRIRRKNSSPPHLQHPSTTGRETRTLPVLRRRQAANGWIPTRHSRRLQRHHSIRKQPQHSPA